MKHGFIKACAPCPDIKVGDIKYNLEKHIEAAKACAEGGARIIVFPELSLTSASCSDMFLNTHLLARAEEALAELVRRTVLLDAIIFVGAPIALCDGVYNCTVAIKGGRVLGIVPLRAQRPFSVGKGIKREVTVGGYTAPFGDLEFCTSMPKGLSIAVRSADELVYPTGATLVAVPAAEPCGVGVAEKREMLVGAFSTANSAATVFANAGVGESGSECVYDGHSVIADGRGISAVRPSFDTGELAVILDIEALLKQKRERGARTDAPEIIDFDFNGTASEMPEYPRLPFVSDSPKQLGVSFEIQAQGLAGRFERSYSKTMVVGISGGLDSTLALLVMARAVDILAARGAKIDRRAISAITMPCFGTTARTKSNAERLAELLGATVRCIDIKAAVSRHFEDIGHSSDNYNVVYENAQARERTQVLMDIANGEGGLVVGTGDLSEAALGWATYNGDHMSMYGVNATLPKTLVRAVVEWYAAQCAEKAVSDILYDILATPVSPELLPPKDGEIAQCTEGIVGPYELHDFFIYHFVKEGASPEKLVRIAAHTFRESYTEDEVRHWCGVFLRRFISQQFKRSCTPDAPSVGIVSLSPRGAWQMPSDFSGALFTSLGE